MQSIPGAFVRFWNPRASYVLAGTKLIEWKALIEASLAALIVTPERAAWILATYPPSDMGRPDILAPHVRERTARVRKTKRAEFAGEEEDGLDVAASAD